jgi:uncharacterized protein (DUF924 family)
MAGDASHKIHAVQSNFGRGSMTANEVAELLDYWRSIGPKAWFSSGETVDSDIREKFSSLHGRAARGELESWRESPESCLALVILLDQISRNLYRGDHRAFAQDANAREVADYAVSRNFDHLVDDNLAFFFYMPFMHGESLADLDRCGRLIHARGLHNVLRYVRLHRDVIERFGKYPHRNALLGRHTTPAEAEFLNSSGFGG